MLAKYKGKYNYGDRYIGRYTGRYKRGPFILLLPMLEKDEDRNINPHNYSTLPIDHTDRWIYHKLPIDVYDPKDYPNCKCGRKYVPIKYKGKLTNKCYYCRNK